VAVLPDVGGIILVAKPPLHLYGLLGEDFDEGRCPTAPADDGNGGGGSFFFRLQHGSFAGKVAKIEGLRQAQKNRQLETAGGLPKEFVWGTTAR
jgi:hypothetical protein